MALLENQGLQECACSAYINQHCMCANLVTFRKHSTKVDIVMFRAVCGDLDPPASGYTLIVSSPTTVMLHPNLTQDRIIS